MDKKLTPKRRAFSDYFIETGNATEEARRAGYKNLMYKEVQNLEKLSIKSYINERLSKIEDARIAKEEVLSEYKNDARVNIDLYVEMCLRTASHIATLLE